MYSQAARDDLSFCRDLGQPSRIAQKRSLWLGERRRPSVTCCSLKILRRRLKAAKGFEAESPPFACNTSNLHFGQR